MRLDLWPSYNDMPARRRLPLVPAFLGLLAVANVASVVLALLE